jgi:hypothetical protein
LDVDANGSMEPLVDGVLVVRFLFDFSGPALTDDAVGPGCMRCDEIDIVAYLSNLEELDVDGDEIAAPLTDGVLVLRFVFGFTGPALISEAVGVDCTRCEAADIESHLAGLV